MPNFTKIAIQQSFLRLLSQRPITKITVKDIVEDCGINRNSFYYHFQDLPQLLETVIIENADEIISRIPESFSLEEGLTTVLERLGGWRTSGPFATFGRRRIGRFTSRI